MKNLKNFLGLLISCLLVVFLFYKVDLLRFIAVLKSVNLYFAFATFIFVFVGCYLRAIRWHYLLLPLKNIKSSDLFPAVIVGYMGNNFLPLRAGEFLRAHFIGKQQNISRVAVFSTIIMERLADGLSILMILIPVIILLKIDMQHALLTATISALILYSAIIVIVWLFNFRQQECLKLIGFLAPKRYQEKIIVLVSSLSDGFTSINNIRQILWVVCFSFIIWLVTALGIQLVVLAFNYQISLIAAMFVLIILTFAVMLPSAPGFVGTFDVAMVYGLILFGVPKEVSLGIAFFFHGVNFLPIVLLGLYYSWKYNIGMGSLNDK